VSSDKFRESDFFNSNLTAIIQRMMNEIMKATKNSALEGNWSFNQINGDGVHGYRVQDLFRQNQPWEPIDPFNPFKPSNPNRPRPGPRRPFDVKAEPMKEISEPLTDIFEDENSIKIYFEVCDSTKDDMQVNITTDKVEIKATNFYKMINLPSVDIDLEKASSNCKNRVLEVIIPKRKDPHNNKDAQRIKIN
jgi:HSP20 family molecular chaperone IbpA